MLKSMEIVDIPETLAHRSIVILPITLVPDLADQITDGQELGAEDLCSAGLIVRVSLLGRALHVS